MFDGTKERLARFRDAEYASVLQPGERLLATGLVQGAFVGQDDIETGPTQVDEVVARARAYLDRLPPVPKGFVAVAGVVAFAADPLAGLVNPDIDRLVGGHIGHGAVGTVASAFKTGLDGGLTYLVVTTHRLGIAVDGDGAVPVPGIEGHTTPPKRFTVDVPRALVLGVRRRRRPFEMGRLELAFVDGSMITVTAGSLSGRRANRLAVALTDPTPNEMA